MPPPPPDPPFCAPPELRLPPLPPPAEVILENTDCDPGFPAPGLFPFPPPPIVIGYPCAVSVSAEGPGLCGGAE